MSAITSTTAFAHLRDRITHPTNRRRRRAAVSAAGAAVMTLGLLAAGVPAANADSMNANAESTYDEPHYWSPPDSNGYTAWSNQDGSWTNSGPDYATTYYSRATTQAMAGHDPDVLASLTPTQQDMIKEACGGVGGLIGGFGATTEAAQLAATINTILGTSVKGAAVAGAFGVVGAVMAVGICSEIMSPGEHPADLLHAAANHGCFQVDSYGRTGTTNHPDYCFDT